MDTERGKQKIMENEYKIKCKTCGVEIVMKDELPVKFSFGKPGSFARLYSRVCHYIEKNFEKSNNCWLLKHGGRWEVDEKECYQMPSDLNFDGSNTPPLT